MATSNLFCLKFSTKKPLDMSHSPLSTYSLGWIKDTTKYSETLIDKIVVCRDISWNGSESIFLAYFSFLCRATIMMIKFEKLFKTDLTKNATMSCLGRAIKMAPRLQNKFQNWKKLAHFLLQWPDQIFRFITFEKLENSYFVLWRV